MTPESPDELDLILDDAIVELRNMAIPVCPALSILPATSAKRTLSTARGGMVAVASVVLLITGGLLWIPSNLREVVVRPKGLLKDKHSTQAIAPLQAGGDRVGLKDEEIAQVSELSPAGLTDRSAIRQVSLETGYREIGLVDLDRLQSEIDGLVEHIRRVEIGDRAQELLEEMRRMVASSK